MPIIEDLRENEDNKKLPGPEQLAQVLEKVAPAALVGVRRILLIDDDPKARKDMRLARHRPIQGLRQQAEIDIFYDRLRAHQQKGATAASFALGELIHLLYDCLSVHQSVTRQLTRRLSSSEEKRRAEAFARARSHETLVAVLGPEESARLAKHESEWSIQASSSEPTRPAAASDSKPAAVKGGEAEAAAKGGQAQSAKKGGGAAKGDVVAPKPKRSEPTPAKPAAKAAAARTEAPGAKPVPATAKAASSGSKGGAASGTKPKTAPEPARSDKKAGPATAGAEAAGRSPRKPKPKA